MHYYEKISRLLDNKSICNKYGLAIDDPKVKIRKDKKKSKKEKRQEYRKYPQRKRKGTNKGYYRYVPKTHYYEPKDIHLQTHKKD